ncbi:hypothetical protein EDB80DRAFT_676174 [Ilyonectria destructans]|nr:hypothetical protein EDB80DRAFT_676174 [Ilyonectria destructans]
MGCCYSKDSDSEGTETWPRSVTPSDNTVQEYSYTSNSPRSNYSPTSPMSPYSMNNHPYPISSQPRNNIVQHTEHTCRGALPSMSNQPSLINSQSSNTTVQHTEHTGRSASPSMIPSDNQSSRNENPGVRHNNQARQVDSRTFTSARTGRRANDLVVPGMAQSQENRGNGHQNESYSLPVPEPAYGRRSESSSPIKISRYARLNVDPIKTIGV